ncbi:MAG: hypothetical protein H0T42_12210 [Deltaproteobacteria bacterium]|nr:hypothetical protein [Deltaproteobacteria bacterium]
MRHLLYLVLFSAACGGAPSSRSISVASDQVSADNHKCGAYAIRTGARTKEGEPITLWMPCWDYTKDSSRYQVRADAATKSKLAQVERTQCIGLAPAALERSPFVQDNAIEEIVPHRGGATVRGANIVFKPIPGLTVSWMRRAIACHQARWRTLGQPATYLAGDPTLVEGAQVDVTAVDDHIVVRISSDTPVSAMTALQRANDLKAPQTAAR